MERKTASDGKPIRFGVNFLPNHAMEALDWVRVAEECGFEIAGIADSQSLYRDVYVVEGLVAANTRTIRFGSRVINPMTRHPAVAASAAATIEELAPGRTMIGIGTGDSSVDNIGVRPAKHAELGAYVKTIRDLLQTGNSIYNGAPCKLTWFRGRIPIYLAASGPKYAATRWRNRRWRRHQYGSHAGNRSRFDRAAKDRLCPCRPKHR